MKSYPLISIFTPTYNRGEKLKRLYNSLKNQTYKDFEWIIVDDGSSDGTPKLIDRFVNEDRINIIYKYQDNQGKYIAINEGLKIARGELFFIVDSDDWLPLDSVESILKIYDNIKHRESFAGLCGIRINPKGEKIGSKIKYDRLECNALDFRYKYRFKGDMSEIIKTEVFKNYKFPEIIGEKFCPEDLIWNRIAKDYKLYYINQPLYVCEYQKDGLSANIIKIRKNSPNLTCLYYTELINQNISLFYNIRSAINFWRFYDKNKIKSKFKFNPIYKILGFIPGKLIRYKERKVI